jgi:predicted hydrocarbon binding protein
LGGYERRDSMKRFEDVRSRLKLTRDHRLVLHDVPMILTPRWVLVNIQKELEKIGGLSKAKEAYYRIGFDSGYTFSQLLRKTEKVSGEDLVRSCLTSISLRGWGNFRIIKLDPKRGAGIFRISRSAISEGYGRIGRTVCHIWAGAMTGVVQEIIDHEGLNHKVKGREVACRSRGDEYCEFRISPILKGPSGPRKI